MDTEGIAPPGLEKVDTAVQGTQTQGEPQKQKSKYLPIVFFVLILLVVGFASYAFIQKFQTKEEAPPLSQESQALTLSLLSPANGDQVVDDELLVRGNTLPNATVVIFTDSDETSVDSDENGYFEGTVLLSEGQNTLTVTAFSDDGQEKSVSVNVTREEES